jgi:hypothetical protein
MLGEEGEVAVPLGREGKIGKGGEVQLSYTRWKTNTPSTRDAGNPS